MNQDLLPEMGLIAPPETIRIAANLASQSCRPLTPVTPRAAIEQQLSRISGITLSGDNFQLRQAATTAITAQLDCMDRIRDAADQRARRAEFDLAEMRRQRNTEIQRYVAADLAQLDARTMGKIIQELTRFLAETDIELDYERVGDASERVYQITGHGQPDVSLIVSLHLHYEDLEIRLPGVNPLVYSLLPDCKLTVQAFMGIAAVFGIKPNGQKMPKRLRTNNSTATSGRRRSRRRR